MSLFDETNTTVSSVSSISTPSYIGGDAILLTENFAEIDGILYEVFRFWERNGAFLGLVKFRSVQLKGGKTAHESISALQFIEDPLLDPRSYEDRAAPTPERVEATVGAFFTDTKPPGFDTTYMVAPGIIAEEINRMYRSLQSVLKHTSWGAVLLERTCGDGLALLSEIEAMASEATPLDVTLVAANFNNFVKLGIPGEITLAALSAFATNHSL